MYLLQRNCFKRPPSNDSSFGVCDFIYIKRFLSDSVTDLPWELVYDVYRGQDLDEKLSHILAFGLCASQGHVLFVLIADYHFSAFQNVRDFDLLESYTLVDDLEVLIFIVYQKVIDLFGF